MPANNWGEVLDAMRGLDSKIATPIKRAIAMIEDLQAAEGALWSAQRDLGTVQGQIAEAETLRVTAERSAQGAQERAAAEIARCQTAMAEAQAGERAALTAAEQTRARTDQEALVRAATLAEEYERREQELEGDIATLLATRDRLTAEITELRRRVGAL